MIRLEIWNLRGHDNKWFVGVETNLVGGVSETVFNHPGKSMQDVDNKRGGRHGSQTVEVKDLGSLL